MDDINDSIAFATRARHSKIPHLALAEECMTAHVISFRPDQPLREVVKILLSKKISGGPVVDEDGMLLGMISELDCLRAHAGSAFEGYFSARDRIVRDEMSKKCITVAPKDDIYKMAHLFEHHSVRRLPVIEDGKLVGQISRCDLLRVIEESL